MDETEAMCEDMSVWVLIDDDFGSPPIRDWTYIWSASPKKYRSSTWGKGMNAEVLYMDAWDWGKGWSSIKAHTDISSHMASVSSIEFALTKAHRYRRTPDTLDAGANRAVKLSQVRPPAAATKTAWYCPTLFPDDRLAK
jgi:hypothetical protein